MVADALPDRFGNSLIDAWLASKGRDPESVNPIERLCYTGSRGMGALEFEPAQHPGEKDASSPLEIAELVDLAKDVLKSRKKVGVNVKANRKVAWETILRVGTSAGGARAKAIIAYNGKTGEMRSGQVASPKGFVQSLIKFDGVTNAGLGDPKGFGRIEYAYYKMALSSGVEMMPSRLLEENGRAHFLTQRFDRVGDRKLHMQSLCALAHFDFNDPNAYAYEQAFQAIREMGLPYPDARQLFVRMVFNVAARNQDDHTKNISFLMDEQGVWRLSPAYDVTYAHDPGNTWIHRHQMSVNGKRDKFRLDDLVKVAKEMNIKKPKEIVEAVLSGVADWPKFAKEAGIPTAQRNSIAKTHRLKELRS
jgi:serine/threonine-protein kinase HipA